MSKNQAFTFKHFGTPYFHCLAHSALFGLNCAQGLVWQLLDFVSDAYDQVSNYLDKTANFSCTRTIFFRFFFGFQIVLYGGCDGGSCKKNQKSQCFVHFLNVLMVRE